MAVHRRYWKYAPHVTRHQLRCDCHLSAIRVRYIKAVESSNKQQTAEELKEFAEELFASKTT
jgi:hypothetical protein